MNDNNEQVSGGLGGRIEAAVRRMQAADTIGVVDGPAGIGKTLAAEWFGEQGAARRRKSKTGGGDDCRQRQ